MRKVLSLLSSIVLVGGLMGAFAAPALADSPDAYHKNCGTYDTGHNPTMYFVKHHDEPGFGVNIEAVRGTIHVGNSNKGYTCVPNGETGNTYIWAANLQNESGAGIIQWGICRIGSTGTWKLCYNLFDGLGGKGIHEIVSPDAIPIVAGHDFYFQITGCKTTLGNWQWCLYVDDLDALSGDPTFRVGRSWDFNDGFQAWWGVEVQDSGGVMGYRSGTDSKTYIYNMMYKRHDTNQWVYRQQSSCTVLNNTGIRSIYFKCATDNTTYTNDTIRVYTLPM
jgi:hypothetical protein